MNTPPRLPSWLLARALRDDPARDAVLGDLLEDFANITKRRGRRLARLWYWREAVPLALGRLAREGFETILRIDHTMNDNSTLRSFLQDTGYAVRTMRRSPAFLVFTAAIIGLGVGATTSVFSVLKPLMLAPLPFQDPGALVWIANGDGTPSTNKSLSAVTSRTSNLRDFRAETRSFEGLTGYNAFFDQSVYTLTGDGARPERLMAVPVAQDFLEVLGVSPLYGRNFTPDEEEFGGPQQAIILTNGFWQRRFAGDPGIVGRSITLDGGSRTVVGVLPPTFDFSSIFSPGVPVDFLLPLPISDQTDRWGNTLVIVGRLREGATPQSAQADLDAVVQALQDADPNRWGLGAYVEPLQQHVAGPFRSALLLLAGAAATVLLIVCVNVSSVMLARVPRRAKDIAVRKALGAPRSRLIRQLVLESLGVSLVGGVLGAALAWVVTGMVAQTAAARIPLIGHAQVDATALSFGILVAALAGLLVGLVPALHVTEGEEAAVMRASSRGSSSSRGATRLREALVVGEIALACGLLVVGGLLLRSFRAVLDVDLGFEADNAVAWQINPNRDFQNVAEVSSYASMLTDRIRQVPGVVEVGLIDALPLGRSRSWGFSIPSRPDLDDQGLLSLYPHMVDGRYLSAMQIPLVEGRTFHPEDDNESAPVLMVNESAAERLFPGQSALGQTFRIFDGREWEIVGVVQDVHHLSPETDPGIQVYFPLAQMWSYTTLDLVVRSTRPAVETASAVSAALNEIDPTIPTQEWWTLRSTVERALSPRRFTLAILSAFGVAALLLAALGIYGVLAQSVAERTPEIGIRMALGASAGDVMRSVMSRTLVLAGFGVALGAGLAFWGSRMVQSLLFEVGASDPLTFVGMGILLLGVAVLAAAVPAVRAARTRGARALQAN